MGTKSVVSMERKTLESEVSHENSKFLTEPKHTDQAELKVPVIYYLSTNGQLQHPHLIYVSISSPNGTLRLQDVINRLSFLRGQGIASMYSWSTKRNYRNGFVWQDLSENDFIYPSNSHEYVLKGTKLIEPSSFGSYETILSMSSSKSSNETKCSSMVEDSSPSSTTNSLRRDYNLYNAKICMDFAEKAANASTQTEEKGRQRMEMDRRSEGFEGNGAARKFDVNEGSLSVSSSSFGSLEGCLDSADIRNQKIENERPSGRMRATQVLMQLVSCRSTGDEL
ncbi:protein SOSEKI 5-like [Trifolium pratense]|uniref:protein SOSEKI 5-like n=1 Tax=Trifolium pratense TaxID=57577 RepID=UPI001E692254|nr:protein SOSEKI 5-like [Trifolium pratense]